MRIVFGTVVCVGLLTCIASFCANATDPLPSVDSIEVDKAAHTLTLLHDHKAIKSYRVAIGRGSIAAKQQEGDRRTPEGRYFIDHHKRDSAFHLALYVSYPNAEDRARAAARGVSPGGDIEIHGLRNWTGWLGSWHRLIDWTDGCIAVTNAEIEEIAAAVPDGTPIVIRP
jgi:murein L,D-transpeptidase YafK